MSAIPRLDGVATNDRLDLVAAGSWTADHARELEPVVDAMARTRGNIHSAALDLRNVERLDTVGAWLIERLRRAFGDRGCELNLVGLDENHRALIEDLAKVNRAPARSPVRAPGLLRALTLVGMAMVGMADSVVFLVGMLGEVASVGVRALVRPGAYRLTSTVHHLERVGWRAVPIILLITFVIGAVLAQQGIFHFRRFGADIFVVDMVGILVLREVGVLIVCIMVAGRSGSAYTAELGAMKMREEIDALNTMGFDPIEVLILPRIVALLIAVPILTFLGSLAALYGGGLVCWLYGGIAPDVFISRLGEAIDLQTFLVGMIKAPFMALVIGVVSCNEGLEVKGSAESLGQQTTASVVKSIFLVIVLDAFFAMFFASIGM